jgi:hypothetical protein
MDEVWTDRDGRAATLHYAGTVEGWFAEGPGQRAPACYELWAGERLVATHTVFPVEPWSAYDAISDRLVAEGWDGPPVEDPGVCPHGLSAALCAGPGHYPLD